MGRIVDLFAEVAASSEDGPDGPVLSGEDSERLRGEGWGDEDLEDILSLVKDSLYQTELVDAADSLSARLVEVLGRFGNEAGFKRALEGGGTVPFEALVHLTRRVARLEEMLELYRDGGGPDRSNFYALQRRLINHGLDHATEPLEAGEE